MARAAAFLDGLIGGIDTNYRWADAMQRRKDAEEDRVWTREERARRVQDRDRSQRIQDEDRAERRRIQTDNERWANEQRARARIGWGSEDEERARTEGDRRTAAEAFDRAREAYEADQASASRRRARAETGLDGIMPPGGQAPAFILPGSSLDQAVAEQQRAPAAPQVAPAAAPQPQATAEEPVIPNYQGGLAAPEMDRAPGAPTPGAQPAEEAPSSRRRFLDALGMLNPFTPANAADVPEDLSDRMRDVARIQAQRAREIAAEAATRRAAASPAPVATPAAPAPAPDSDLPQLPDLGLRAEPSEAEVMEDVNRRSAEDEARRAAQPAPEAQPTEAEVRQQQWNAMTAEEQRQQIRDTVTRSGLPQEEQARTMEDLNARADSRRQEAWNTLTLEQQEQQIRDTVGRQASLSPEEQARLIDELTETARRRRQPAAPVDPGAPPEVGAAAPALGVPEAAAPIPAPRRPRQEPELPPVPQGLPERPPAVNTVPEDRPPGMERDMSREGHPELSAAPSAAPEAPMPTTQPQPPALNEARQQGLGDIGPARAIADPRLIPGGAPAAAAPLTPSQQVAQETLLGPRRPQRAAATEGLDREREGAATHVADFMTYYQREAVPMIRDNYLRNGDVAKAQAFDSWARDDSSRRGQAAWARGVRAASVGDEEGFITSMIDAYNSDGYFDDGYEIQRRGSELIRDDEGNITGARLTFKDQETGQTSTRDFNDIGDLYEFGVNFLAPENVFEYGIGQIQAAQTAQRQLELARVRAAERSVQTPQQRVAAVTKTLAENDPGFASLPPEEKSRKILEQIQMEDSAAAALAGQPTRAAGRTGVPMWTGD